MKTKPKWTDEEGRKQEKCNVDQEESGIGMVENTSKWWNTIYRYLPLHYVIPDSIIIASLQ